jgi:hypothetical protein
MMMKTQEIECGQENATVLAKVWIGTTQYDFWVNSYEAAMAAAGKTQNASGPTFFAVENGVVGEQLFDDGACLRTAD